MTRPGEPTAAGPTRGPAVAAWALSATAVAAAATGLGLDLVGDGPPGWKWVLLALAVSVPGALIAGARPRAGLGWLLVMVALTFSLIGLSRAWLAHADGVVPVLTTSAVWYADRFGAITMPLTVVALMLLPDSRLPGPRWRGPVAATVLVQVVLVVAWSFSATPAAAPESGWSAEVGALGNPVGVLPEAWAESVSTLGWLLPLPLLLPVAGMAARLRRSRGEDRARLVVLLLALAVLVGAILAGGALGSPLDVVTEGLATLFLGVVLVSAVLRRQLEGVRVVVNHAFVLTALGAVVVVSYVLAVGALAAAGPELSRFGAGVVAACAALLVQPLHSRLRRWVDRVTHGDRRDPFQAVTRLAERAHTAPSLPGVLSAVAASMATSLHAPSVTVEAFGVRAGHPTDAQPEDGPERQHRVPLVVGDRTLGAAVAVLQPGRRLRADEVRLFAELGRHAGVAVDAVHLAEQVAEHHRALVTAREEERRRLGRELHDDLGPTVAGLSMQLGALRPLVHRDPDAVVARLARLEESAAEALTAIRRVAHELRPPVLDQVGLARAVTQVAESLDLMVVDETVDHGPLPAAVEVAAYRICGEALANVARHSGGGSVVVQLRETAGCLVVVVEDHGRGPGAATPSGLGLSTMRERAEELGGTFTVRPGAGAGTVVTAVLPLTGSTAATSQEAR